MSMPRPPKDSPPPTGEFQLGMGRDVVVGDLGVDVLREDLAVRIDKKGAKGLVACRSCLLRQFYGPT
jgi:hypothetical protein